MRVTEEFTVSSIVTCLALVALIGTCSCTTPTPAADPGTDTRPDAAVYDARPPACDITEEYDRRMDLYCTLACSSTGIGRFEPDCELKCPLDVNAVFQDLLEIGLRFEECGVCR